MLQAFNADVACSVSVCVLFMTWCELECNKARSLLNLGLMLSFLHACLAYDGIMAVASICCHHDICMAGCCRQHRSWLRPLCTAGVQVLTTECPTGISKLEFDKDGIIKSMVSSEGELVPFKKPIDPAKANGAVEKWLAQVHDTCCILQCILSADSRSSRSLRHRTPPEQHEQPLAIQ